MAICEHEEFDACNYDELGDSDFAMIMEDLNDIGIEFGEASDMIDDFRLMGIEFDDVRELIFDMEWVNDDETYSTAQDILDENGEL